MTKHNRIVEPGTVQRDTTADVLRELSELADELQRNGMARGAASVRKAVKLIRRLGAPT